MRSQNNTSRRENEKHTYENIVFSDIRDDESSKRSET